MDFLSADLIIITHNSLCLQNKPSKMKKMKLGFSAESKQLQAHLDLQPPPDFCR